MRISLYLARKLPLQCVVLHSVDLLRINMTSSDVVTDSVCDCRSSEVTLDCDSNDNSAAAAVESIMIPSSQQCLERRGVDEEATTQRRPKTADAELSSVRTTSAATQTSSPTHTVMHRTTQCHVSSCGQWSVDILYSKRGLSSWDFPQSFPLYGI